MVTFIILSLSLLLIILVFQATIVKIKGHVNYVFKTNPNVPFDAKAEIT